MTDAANPRRLALLIDAENIAPDFMQQVLPEVLKLGRPVIQYAYGDFSIEALKPWVTFLRQNIMEARQVTPAQSGKNAADIALVVDAMEIALRERCDAVCVVSSDRDFVALTLFLRREGVDVYGFGKSHADKKFRQSCAKFFELKEKVAEPKVSGTTPVRASVAATKPPPESATNWPAILQEVVRLTPKCGWLSLQILGSALGKKEIRAKDHGGATWAQVFKKSAGFEIRKDDDGKTSVRIVAALAA